LNSLAAESLFIALADVAAAGGVAPGVAPVQAPAPTAAALSWSADGVILQTILVLAVVAVLAILIVRFGVKRVALGPEWRGGANLKVIERLSLEPRRSIVLVRAGDKYLLLATSEAGVSLVREVPAHEIVTPIDPGGTLKSIWQRMTGTGGPAVSGPADGAPRT
jgi:flagellar biosynthetic protein FliO